jgi:hypothetical protein
MKIKIYDLNLLIKEELRNSIPRWFKSELEFDFPYLVKTGLMVQAKEYEGKAIVGINLWRSEDPSEGENRCGQVFFINKGTDESPNILAFPEELENNDQLSLEHLGFINEIGENPPGCILKEPLKKYFPNIMDFSSVILALTFHSGGPAYPTAKSYVFYFYRGKVDPHQKPDEILTFKIRLDDPTKVQIIDKYLGGFAFGAQWAPALAYRDVWRPGLMSKEAEDAEIKKLISDHQIKQGDKAKTLRFKSLVIFAVIVIGVLVAFYMYNQQSGQGKQPSAKATKGVTKKSIIRNKVISTAIASGSGVNDNDLRAGSISKRDVNIVCWGEDLTDGTIGGWKSRYPHCVLDDGGGDANAIYDGSFEISKNKLCVKMHNLHSEAPPAHTLAVGFHLYLTNGSFLDGLNEKVIEMARFTWNPREKNAKKCFDIIR